MENPHELFTKINRWIYYQISKIYGPLGVAFVLPQIQTLFFTTSVDINTKYALIQENFTHSAKNRKFKINRILHLFYEYMNHLETQDFSIPRRSFLKYQHRYLEIMHNFNYYASTQNFNSNEQLPESNNLLNESIDQSSPQLNVQNPQMMSNLGSQGQFQFLQSKSPFQLPENEYFDEEEEEEEEELEEEEEEEEEEFNEKNNNQPKLFIKNKQNQINETNKISFNKIEKDDTNKDKELNLLFLHKDDNVEEEECIDYMDFLEEVYTNPGKFNPMISLTNHYLQQPDTNISEDFINWFNGYCNHVNSVLVDAFRQFKEQKTNSQKVALPNQIYLTNPVVQLLAFCKEKSPIIFYKKFKQMLFIQEKMDQKQKNEIIIKYIKGKQDENLDTSYIMISSNMVSGQVKNELKDIANQLNQLAKIEITQKAAQHEAKSTNVGQKQFQSEVKPKSDGPISIQSETQQTRDQQSPIQSDAKQTDDIQNPFLQGTSPKSADPKSLTSGIKLNPFAQKQPLSDMKQSTDDQNPFLRGKELASDEPILIPPETQQTRDQQSPIQSDAKQTDDIQNPFLQGTRPKSIDSKSITSGIKLNPFAQKQPLSDMKQSTDGQNLFLRGKELASDEPISNQPETQQTGDQQSPIQSDAKQTDDIQNPILSEEKPKSLISGIKPNPFELNPLSSDAKRSTEIENPDIELKENTNPQFTELPKGNKFAAFFKPPTPKSKSKEKEEEEYSDSEFTYSEEEEEEEAKDDENEKIITDDTKTTKHEKPESLTIIDKKENVEDIIIEEEEEDKSEIVEDKKDTNIKSSEIPIVDQQKEIIKIEEEKVLKPPAPKINIIGQPEDNDSFEGEEEDQLEESDEIKIDPSSLAVEKYKIGDKDTNDKYGSIEFLVPVNQKQFGIEKVESDSPFYFSSFFKFNECSIDLQNKGKIMKIKDRHFPMKVTLENVYPLNYANNKREMPEYQDELEVFKESINEYLESKNLELDTYDQKTGKLSFIVNRISDFPIEIPEC